MRPPRGGRLGALTASVSVQDSSGTVYSVPAGTLPADGRYHQLIAELSGPGHPPACRVGRLTRSACWACP